MTNSRILRKFRQNTSCYPISPSQMRKTVGLSTTGLQFNLVGAFHRNRTKIFFAAHADHSINTKFVRNLRYKLTFSKWASNQKNYLKFLKMFCDCYREGPATECYLRGCGDRIRGGRRPPRILSQHPSFAGTLLNINIKVYIGYKKYVGYKSVY